MSIQQTYEQLINLKLRAMAERYMLDQDNPDALSMSFDERFAIYAEAQISQQAQVRYERNLKLSKIKHITACMENIIYSGNRSLEKSKVSPLSICDWVSRHQNILLTGATGVGKSYIASALGVEAIRKGWKVIYKRVPRLVEEMELARAEGSLGRLRDRLAKFNVLILDDWGIHPLSPYNRQDLLEIVEDKTGSGSIIITSQLPVTKWHEYIGENTIADAIVDRVVHRAHRIDLNGESMRKLQGFKDEVSHDS